MKFADLHIHTHFSDSTLSPSEVIEQAYKADLYAIAITDHDTIDGIKPSLKAAEKYGIEVISGVELSSEINGKDVHILGYFFDYENLLLNEKLNLMQEIRVERMKKMIEKLYGLGVKDITLEEVCLLAQSKAVGRPHLASVLMKKKKVGTTKEAFDKFLAEGAAAYVPKFQQSPLEAIELIHQAGGLCVLAHPMFTSMDEIIPALVKSGLDGIEAYYPHCSLNVVNFYEGLAKKNNIFVTGGSDSHGKARPQTFIGRIKLPYTFVEGMKEKLKK